MNNPNDESGKHIEKHLRAAQLENLTEREKEVVELLCRGYCNKDIASALSVSVHTVRAHLLRIFSKYNVTSRFKLMALVMDSRQTSASELSGNSADSHD